MKFTPANLNPFATSHWARIPFKFMTGDWECHLNRLQQLRYRAAIAGPCGSGKSKLLMELANRLEAIGKSTCLVDLPHENNNHQQLLTAGIERCNAGAILLLDGIERLSLRQKLSVYRGTPNGLVFTCHRKPIIGKTWIKCQTNPDLMRYVIGRLGIDETELPVTAEVGLSQCQGNIREVLFMLYREYSRRESIEGP